MTEWEYVAVGKHYTIANLTLSWLSFGDRCPALIFSITHFCTLSPNWIGDNVHSSWAFIIPLLIASSPTPAALKHPYTMMFLSPCFTVVTFLWSKSLLGLLPNCQPADTKMLNLDSSVKRTFSQKSSGLFAWTLGKSRLLFLFTSLLKGFFLVVVPL